MGLSSIRRRRGRFGRWPWLGLAGLAAGWLAAAPALTVVTVAGALAAGGGGDAATISSPGPGPRGSGTWPPGVPPAEAIATTLPPAMARLYRRAAASVCPGLPWQVLAGIGTVESGNGTSEAPGVHRGANAAGAEGPMQFEPATFVAYDEPTPPGGAFPPSPYDPVDAVYAAARLLCTDGAGRGHLQGAVYDYNHSRQYVAEVLAVAIGLGMPG